jgi:hypothetical protein
MLQQNRRINLEKTKELKRVIEAVQYEEVKKNVVFRFVTPYGLVDG